MLGARAIRRWCGSTGIALLFGCASARVDAGAKALEGPEVARAVPESTLARETSLGLGSTQATVTVPGGWHTHGAGEALWLEDPERDLTIAVLALSAPDADTAISEGWRRIGQHFAQLLESSEDDPHPAPWDAVSVRYFEPGDDIPRVLAAVARRKGNTWYLVLIDGDSRAVARRQAQVDSIVGELHVAGAREPSWAARPFGLDAARLARLDAFVEQARQRTLVPGAALAVVTQDRVLLAKGYGDRALGERGKVSPETLFLIGSMTKPLTTLMLARLVSEQRLGWDTPVKQLLPSLRLGDATLTDHARLEDTVCACSGMPSRDLEFLFEWRGWDPERRIASLQGMKPTTALGETFQYSNLMVALGGFVGAHVWAPGARLGDAYDRAMAELVLGPLGMRATSFDFDRALGAEHAEGHAQGLSAEYQRSPVDYERAMSVIRPAAGAWSNVNDLGRYLQLELARGKLPNGTQLVSEAALLERRKPRVKVSAGTTYALGLELEHLHDIEIIGHTGSMLGYSGLLMFVPKADVGLVLLTNASATDLLLSAVRDRFLEIAFDEPGDAEATLVRGVAAARQQFDEYRSDLIAPEPEFLEPLLGEYQDPNLGQIEIRREGRKVILDVGEWQSELLEEAGEVPTLVTITPPFADFELQPVEREGRTVLVLDDDQQEYAFEPVHGPPVRAVHRSLDARRR
jgi:CubicO group peptidase (beta-lactamase class C family)